MAHGRARDERKERQWRRWIGEWQASGLSVRPRQVRNRSRSPQVRRARRRHRTPTPLPDLVSSPKPCSAGCRAGTRPRPCHTRFSGQAHSVTQRGPGFRQRLYSS
jgi:hypothetical protein